jgi:hypothetical protein
VPESYPYIISNNKLEPALSKIRSAAKPSRFTQEFLKKMGFTASNDRAILPILRELGFLNENGAPTDAYDRLRDQTDWRFVLGEKVKELYSDLFAINTNIHKAPEGEIKGAISRITGKDGKMVGRYYTTFKTLSSLANFDGRAVQDKAEPPEADEKSKDVSAPARVEVPMPMTNATNTGAQQPSFHYNIQIHLPATTDISVFNAIFRSLKENLGI